MDNQASALLKNFESSVEPEPQGASCRNRNCSVHKAASTVSAVHIFNNLYYRSNSFNSTIMLTFTVFVLNNFQFALQNGRSMSRSRIQILYTELEPHQNDVAPRHGICKVVICIGILQMYILI
jgi:hypothetical protein